MNEHDQVVLLFSSQTHDTSELSTFNEYDMMTDDDQTPMAGHTDCSAFINEMMTLRPTLGSEDDHDSAFSGKSSETQEPRYVVCRIHVHWVLTVIYFLWTPLHPSKIVLYQIRRCPFIRGS